MQSAGGGTPVAAPARPRQRVQTGLFALAFVGLVFGTGSGFLLARDRAETNAERTAEEAASRASTELDTQLRQRITGLAGSSVVLGADGELDVDVFASFAGGLLVSEELNGLTLVGTGLDDGSPYPILAVEPPDGGAVVGDDFGSDRVLVEALRSASRTQGPTISGVFDPVGPDEPRAELIRPVLDRTASTPVVRGFVTTPVPVQELADIAADAAGPDHDVSLLTGGELVFGPAFDRRVETTSSSATVPDGDWTVVVGPVADPDLTLAWLIVAGGGVAIVAMGTLMIATVRHQRRLARTNGLLARSEARTRAVHEVAGRLARALSGDDIVTALVDHLPAAVGARSAVIATTDEAGHLHMLGPDVEGASRRDRFLRGDLSGSQVDEVLRSDRSVWLSSPLGWRNDEATAAMAGDGDALALLPLRADDVEGVLAVSYPRIRIFAEEEQALLETVGLLAATALARGQRYDAEHRAALAFQHAALPSDLPAVDGLTIAARYRPATRQATVGGDWYDVLVLDDRRVVLVVGDVVGHGMVAAAAMGRLRTAFQAIVPLSADPGAMLRALSSQVESIPDSFCTTVVCAVVDLEAGTMAWSRAGHPPPMVLRRGEATLLDERGIPPLGVVPDAPPVHTCGLDPGDVVILYTDGIIERRGESIDDGFERMGIVADNLADLDPEEFSDALVEALVPAAEQADDLALLVVRVDGCAPALPMERPMAASSPAGS